MLIQQVAGEHLVRCLVAEAFARRVVEAVGDGLDLTRGEAGDVDLAPQEVAQPTIGILERSLLLSPRLQVMRPLNRR